MLKKTTLIVLITFLLVAFNQLIEKKSYKCLIQMNQYHGEGAYVIISLINPQGKYDETLYVFGEDDEWYFDIHEWFGFYGKKRTPLDGITGATISGGQRSICRLNINSEKINKGYKLRFETAVEDQEYYPKELEILLDHTSLNQKLSGEGFIKYVRIMEE